LIDDEIDFNGETYKVTTMDGRHCFNYCDPYNTRIRIYTVLKND